MSQGFQPKKTSKSSLSTTPKIHKPMTLEEHEEMKKQKLEKLKKQSKADKKVFEELGVKTRKRQLEKGKSLAQGNPLAVDQAAIYDKDMARLRRKYTNGSK
ncbi:hypothetical protein M9Y10_014999 [Tritrichomonas musculus]|uniref:Uncharacterized protein n=1 Tax=Tritrichomonas musculus TaxID=1915356 RepID=A0ABR2L489_9EUKA